MVIHTLYSLYYNVNLMLFMLLFVLEDLDWVDVVYSRNG